ncbi:MAG: NADPH-dependent oxidoreductase [Azospirillaceae bacterium]|nr:NADPH-dependent oxidoreductase [Azospirillaceae bacterium]
MSETSAAAALWARYRAAEPSPSADPATLPWNEVLATVLAHKSVRSYLPTPVPPGTLELLIAAAQSAATSSNLQAWSVVAVEDPERKGRLSEFTGSQRHVRDCPLFLVWLADLARLDRIGKDHGSPLAGLDYLEVLIVAIIDAALAAQNAVVALESLGLGAVYVGAIRNRPEQVSAELGLPPLVMPVFGLCVGYPDPEHPASVKPRLPQGAVLHREQYSLDATRQPIADYDAILQDFQREQAMKPQGWIDLVRGRLETVAALKGRDRLRAALQSLGFALK